MRDVRIDNLALYNNPGDQDEDIWRVEVLNEAKRTDDVCKLVGVRYVYMPIANRLTNETACRR